MKIKMIDLVRMEAGQLLTLKDKALDRAVALFVMKYPAKGAFSPTTKGKDEVKVRGYIEEHYPAFNFNLVALGGPCFFAPVEYRDKSVRCGRGYGAWLPGDLSSGRFACLWALMIVRHLALERLEAFADIIFGDDFPEQLEAWEKGGQP